MRSVKITVLVDDLNAPMNGYSLSYGFAALIELDGKKILFDAGTNIDPLMKNLTTFQVSASELDAVILSHNHYDHTDGLPGILEENKEIPVYIHKDWDKPASFKGFQVPPKNRIVIHKARQIIELSADLFLTNSYFANDYGGVYEHACYIKANASYILLCGCCHPGLNVYLQDRKELGVPVSSSLHILGGLHGFKFNRQKARKILSILNSITLFHCTMNVKTFQNQFGELCRIGTVGKEMIF